MRRQQLITSLLVVCTLLLLACTERPALTPEVNAPPKVILIIGDGMDDQQITMARTYLTGSGGRLTLDTMPYRGVVRVLGISNENPDQMVYVTDSANTATAMATGVLTSRARIGTAASTDDDLDTIMELASSSNIGTGIVTTASVTDATPASFLAHVNHRWCQGPESMEGKFEGAPQLNYDCVGRYKANGGAGSIAEQIAESNVDFVLGGGSKHFEQLVEGSADTIVVELAHSNGFRLIDDRLQLSALTADSRILGLFAPDTLPVRLRGTDDAKAELLSKEDGRLHEPEPFACEPNPEFDDVPSLADMTDFALKGFDDGGSFVLVVESASIDKQAHIRRPCGHIGELGQLDDALQIALGYAESHPETLILVTADHAQAAHIIPETSFFAPQGFGSPGHVARVRTPEGSIMGVNYATTDMQWEDHSGSQVPIYVSGPGADKFPTLIEQTDIFHIMASHLGLSETWPRR